ncbi:unnamed protein product (macronuclear) [Paramecium tetraurelia]|uniref:Uncharacterized protein n=1 Tax=Paramecium tetraurelia TaxID=5888 RepID=A0C764_PARTE|nr:uncharacterized protein GSPATT00035761001 [Paramecium tetraurelia]CAK66631.1 unnamed protein product [Paramecium tetraurelia]|eukprot:XP_001434028.1 hypothetical protein (macronuclear) [Paramecium tetraurelia strain d4-2]
MIKTQLIDLLKLTEEDLKKTVIVKQHPQYEQIFFMILNQKANTFTHKFVREIHEALTSIEQHEGHTALITTSFHPTVFSGGLDLNVTGNMNIFDRNNFVLEFIRLLGRLLRYPVPTIALVNGHAVAGGCMFMFAHDWRIARAEPKKAHCSLPEIEIGMYLPPGMNAVCQCKLTPSVHRDLCLLARRYDLGSEGLQYQMVDGLATEDKIVEASIQKALAVAKYGQDKENFTKIKEEMHRDAIKACFSRQMAPGNAYDLGLPRL